MRRRNGGGFVFALMVVVLSLLFFGWVPGWSGPGVAGEVYATGAASVSGEAYADGQGTLGAAGLGVSGSVYAAGQGVAEAVYGSGVRVFVVHSATSAKLVVDAVGQLLQNPTVAQEVYFRVRSTQQVADTDQAQLKEFLEQSDLVLIEWCFRPGMLKIQTILEQNPGLLTPQKDFVVVASEISLARYTTIGGQRVFDGLDDATLDKILNVDKETDAQAKLSVWEQAYPQIKPWSDVRRYYEARGTENYIEQLKLVISRWAERNNRPELVLGYAPYKSVPRQMVYSPWDKRTYTSVNDYVYASETLGHWQPGRPVAGLIEYDSPVLAGNTAHLDLLAEKLEKQGFNVLPVGAKYGEDTYEALVKFFSTAPSGTDWEKNPNAYEPRVDVVVSCGTFSLGSGKKYEQTNSFLRWLDVPVLRAVTSTKRPPEEWEASAEGLPWGEVYYQIALPEIQGIAEPVFVAGQGTYVDDLTGAGVTAYVPVPERIERVARRARAWVDLTRTPLAEKRVALIYYNYPPGKQNIGASYLAVPDSILGILQALKEKGYRTGDALPQGPEELVSLLLQAGINVAGWAPGVLDQLAGQAVAGAVYGPVLWSADRYRQWFDRQSELVQKEMIEGPCGYIEAYVRRALELNQPAQAEKTVAAWQRELQSLLSGMKGQDAAAPLLDRMVAALNRVIATTGAEREQAWQDFLRAKEQFRALNLPGMSGWGEPPGNVMVVDRGGQQYLVLPGLVFGNIFVGPQPQRGWEADAGKLYHSLVVPPPHQYLAFYAYLGEEFGAHALIHLGRHGTYEWLPHKQALLTPGDYPDVVVSDRPSIYVYIVDGIGEGLQAKRRGLAVIVDHLTPPLQPTELYGDLVQLKALVEDYEKMAGATEELQLRLRQSYLEQIKAKIADLHLEAELPPGLDGDELVEAVHHYLLELESTLMPYGLHVFGSRWADDKVAALACAMVSLDGGPNAPSLQRVLAKTQGWDYDRLTASQLEQLNRMARSAVAACLEKPPSVVAAAYTNDPNLQAELSGVLDTAREYIEKVLASFPNELANLLDALDGRFVDPGQGNDPVRNPAALPTGRNFYGLDPSQIPTKAAYELGRKLADEAWQRLVGEAAAAGQPPPEKVAAVVWCVETARDDGTMVSFVLRLMGVHPVWDKAGAVKGNVAPDRLDDLNRPRVDVVVTTSGLFRDIYGQVLVLMDRGFRVALAASYDPIVRDHPDLKGALDAALQPLAAAKLLVKGNDPLDRNFVAKHWVAAAQQLLQAGLPAEEAGILAITRIFAPPVGDYGAGVSHAVEQAWTWEDRGQIADLYLQRMSHAYSEQMWGEAHPELLRSLLEGVTAAFHSRSSNLYGVLDNDDCFDYFGGLSMAIERVNEGRAPQSYILSDANPAQAQVMTLTEYLTRELRTRYYNPEWIRGMMEMGYSGARSLDRDFVANLWGWQVTNPTLIQDWMWNEVADVYLRDKYGLGVRDWLAQGNNAYALISITGTMLTAAQKGFWQADEATLRELANTWARAIIQHGPACCDCSCGNLKMMQWATQFVDSRLLLQLNNVLQNAIRQPVLSPEQLAALTPRGGGSARPAAAAPPSEPKPETQPPEQPKPEETRPPTTQAPKPEEVPPRPEEAPPAQPAPSAVPGTPTTEEAAPAIAAGPTPGPEPGTVAPAAPAVQATPAPSPAPSAAEEPAARAYEVEREPAAAGRGAVPLIAVLGVVALVALGAAGYFLARRRGV
ncbi:MAG: cobaltochelatase subunit CobN [Desulfotomaculales bacterium]